MRWLQIACLNTTEIFRQCSYDLLPLLFILNWANWGQKNNIKIAFFLLLLLHIKNKRHRMFFIDPQNKVIEITQPVEHTGALAFRCNHYCKTIGTILLYAVQKVCCKCPLRSKSPELCRYYELKCVWGLQDSKDVDFAVKSLLAGMLFLYSSFNY